MVLHSLFEAENGCSEHFFSAVSHPGYSFAAEAESLLSEYDHQTAEFGCSVRTEFLLRFHLSDVSNQAPVLRGMLAGRHSFISIVGQPPAEGARLALEAWHVNPMEKTALSNHSFCFRFRNYEAVLSEGENPEAKDSFSQTADEFLSLEKILAGHSGSVADNAIRTWLYCRDVDNNYAGLVRARNEYFTKIGLTRDTHFIASTGIEGQAEVPSRLVTMDSLSFIGLEPGQQIYLSAPEMLSPTALYGVSFERGTRLVFGDRSHYYISGTASIDKHGKVVHPGDVRLQTVRMLDNVEALLHSSGGSICDLKCATVYLRDSADAEAVRGEFAQRLPAALPLVILRAPVCRTAWLVEMEAIGINSCGNDSLKKLL